MQVSLCLSLFVHQNNDSKGKGKQGGTDAWAVILILIFFCSSVQIEKHVKLLSEVTPEWLTITYVRKCPYVKLKKNVNINSLVEKLKSKEVHWWMFEVKSVETGQSPEINVLELGQLSFRLHLRKMNGRGVYRVCVYEEWQYIDTSSHFWTKLEVWVVDSEAILKRHRSFNFKTTFLIVLHLFRKRTWL